MKLSISALTATLLLTFTPSAALANEITGKQYLNTKNGAMALSDHEILYLPCAPVYGHCKETEAKIRGQLESAYIAVVVNTIDEIEQCVKKHGSRFLPSCTKGANWNHMERAKSYEQTVKQLRLYFLNQTSAKQTRTGFNGDFNINCPTENCLVFSTITKQNNIFTWVELMPSGHITDLSKSKAKNLPLQF